MSLDRVVHRFTVDEYQAMASAGLLADGPRVELIEGEIIEMAPIGPPHASSVDRLTMLFATAVGPRAIVRVQSSVVLRPMSQPEPDIALLAPRQDWYAEAHPEPADILLVIEVSDTSLAFDRRVKVPLYARYGIAECWIVDLAGRSVDVHRQPGPGRYAHVTRCVPGQRIEPLALEDVTLDVADIVGPARP